MVINRSVGLLLSGTLFGASLLTTPALADDVHNEQLQRQINALQRQLQSLQRQVTETKKEAKAAARALPPNIYNASPSPVVYKGGPSWLPAGISVSFAGSYIEAATAWRQHNEISSGASDPPFSSLPLSNSPLGHEDEWRASAQQSRLAVKMSGDIDPAQHLKAYYEMDFLGAGVTANSRESNSYNLRVRQAFLEYDNDNYHFHVVGGQAWSLLTQNRVGMLPETENAPLSIDAQYVAGFNWARQEQLRFVADWNKVAWFGVSVESPQVNFPSNGVFPFSGASAAANTGGSTIPPGLVVNDVNQCNASGLLDSTTACSNDVAPDVVEKFALDPGWGHYEVFGLQRWFADEVGVAGPPFGPVGGVANSFTQKTTFGYGIGGSVLLPVIPKYLDFQASVLTGKGTGRYGASQLPDVTVGPNGALTALQTTQFLLGVVARPWTGMDLYGYYGQEQVGSSFWTNGATAGGYGNPSFLNNGCLNEDLVSGAAAFNEAAAGTTCTGNVQRVREFTVGFWQNIYKGAVGRVVFGMQYEYVKLDLFPGLPSQTAAAAKAGGTPNLGLNPSNNVFFTSLRYYPF